MHSPLPRVATLPTRVRKRDGREAPFDAHNIESAIGRAGRATREFGALEATLLTAQVVKVISHRSDLGRMPDIEGIQDVVEQTLISANHFETARAYIVYREQHKKLREDRRTLVDVAGSINEYLDRSDWRVSANANQGYPMSTPRRSARPTVRGTSTSTISTCSPATAPAGPCAHFCTKG